MTIEELDNKLMGLYMIESMSGTEDVRKYFPNISEDSNLAHFQVLAPEYCLRAKHIILARHASDVKEDRESSAGMNLIVQDIIKSDYKNIPYAKSLLYPDIELVVQQISIYSFVSLIKRIDDITDDKRVVRTALNLDALFISMGYYTYITALINNSFNNSFNELFIKAWCNYFENIFARAMMFKMAKDTWKEDRKGVPF